MTTELLDAPQSAVAAYQPFYAQLATLEADNSKLTFDYESKKGNKEARSHVNTLRLTKGTLERTRTEAKAESLRIGRAIDSEAAEIKARIEVMISVHQIKLDEIEKREADRITALEARLTVFAGHSFIDATVAAVQAEIAKVEAIAIDESWGEFIANAAQGKDAALAILKKDLVDFEKRDAEAAELERLRAEAAERAQKDRDDAIAKAAEERAKAEASARAERAAAAARQAIEDAEAKAKAEREAAERRELELKLAAENAERRRVESEQRAEQDRKDAIARAEQQAAEAVEREKERVAEVARAYAAETAKREANKKHKAAINNKALDALVAGGINADCAKECIKLIASGAIPSVTIAY